MSYTPELLAYLTPAERAELEGLAILHSELIWRPLPGPQRQAYQSQADIIGFGGAAGGGKTDLACGMALTGHQKAMIMRREGPQLQGIFDRLTSLLGNRDGFASQDRIWRLGEAHGNRQIEFGAVPNLGDETKYMGRPHDLLVFDEASNFLEAQVRFLMGWVRTEDPTQRARVLMTFNPPTTAEGRWVISFFAPWLDDRHPNPAKPGELRYFTTIDGKDRELEDGRPFVLEGNELVYDFDPDAYKPEDIVTPKSRTFIPSRVSDNPYYVKTGYLAQLQGLPEPLRSQMLEGNFLAGMEDDPWQVIPTIWIDEAMARWQPFQSQKGPMDSMGVDCARGGKDNEVIARRHGLWFDEPIVNPGSSVPNGPVTLGNIMVARRDHAPVHIDVIGWGSSPYDFMVDNEVHAVAVNNAEGTNEMNREGTMGFYNVRARDIWRMREALDPTNRDRVALPPNNKLRGDLAAPKWSFTTRGILVESKEEIYKRLGRSTDYGDAYVMALRSTPKRQNDRGRVRSGRRGGGGSAWAA